jgi:hypothetical protein
MIGIYSKRQGNMPDLKEITDGTTSSDMEIILCIYFDVVVASQLSGMVGMRRKGFN